MTTQDDESNGMHVANAAWSHCLHIYEKAVSSSNTDAHWMDNRMPDLPGHGGCILPLPAKHGGARAASSRAALRAATSIAALMSLA